MMIYNGCGHSGLEVMNAKWETLRFSKILTAEWLSKLCNDRDKYLPITTSKEASPKTGDFCFMSNLVKLWFRALSLFFFLFFYWFAKVENQSKEGTTKNCNMSDISLHQCGSIIWDNLQTVFTPIRNLINTRQQ